MCIIFPTSLVLSESPLATIKVNTVINALKFTEQIVWNRLEEDTCEDENGDEVVDKQLCTIGDRTFPYFPKIGIAPSSAPQFLERTSPKDQCDKKIMYLDFETTVVGYSHFDNEGHRAREPPIPQQNLPVSPLDRYEPYPFVP